ncbi:hypothetical protein [Sorangium sp. So ce1097]|uniref:hypothetical protein n=1 Tax=Sorangium sp. So ce1097 TaxID=3133330 RepID=UPI003F5FDB6F
MTVRPDRTVSPGQPEPGHHHDEDRHGGPNGARHHLEEERLERLVRAAQEVSHQAARDRRRGADPDRRADGGPVDARPAPRTASMADIERAADEGMLSPEET